MSGSGSSSGSMNGSSSMNDYVSSGRGPNYGGANANRVPDGYSIVGGTGGDSTLVNGGSQWNPATGRWEAIPVAATASPSSSTTTKLATTGGPSFMTGGGGGVAAPEAAPSGNTSETVGPGAADPGGRFDSATALAGQLGTRRNKSPYLSNNFISLIGGVGGLGRSAADARRSLIGEGA